MKKHFRRLLVTIGIMAVVLSIIPFLIPISEGGIPPAQLVTDPDGKFIALQGVNVYYEDKGDRAAPCVILVHGLFGSTQSWRYNLETLVSAGYRVLAFDRPGFGLSDKPESFNYAVSNQADLLAQLMDALNIGKAVVVGHSAGGNVVAHFAVRHADRLEKLVLVDAAVLAGGPPGFVGALVGLPPVWRWGRVALHAYFTRENLENTLRGFYADPFFMTQADYDTYWRAFQTPGWDIALLGLTRDGGGNLLSEAQLRGITARTLLLWGGSDLTTPVVQGEKLAALIPGSQFAVISGAGHQPFEEAAPAFNDALLAFLKQ